METVVYCPHREAWVDELNRDLAAHGWDVRSFSTSSCVLYTRCGSASVAAKDGVAIVNASDDE